MEQPVKRQRVEEESEAPNFARKTKACAKFFSVNGCPYWSGCNFLHSTPPGSRGNPAYEVQSNSHTMEAKRKTKLCANFTKPEGCSYGDKCSFAHGEQELQQHRTSRGGGPSNQGAYNPAGNMMGGGYVQQNMGRPPAADNSMGFAPPTGDWSSGPPQTMSVPEDCVGALIGKRGATVKLFMQLSNAKLEVAQTALPTDLPGTRTVLISGQPEQVAMARTLVQQFVTQFQTTPGQGMGKPPSNQKTKLCRNFMSGDCRHGANCFFAHGEVELRPAN